MPGAITSAPGPNARSAATEAAIMTPCAKGSAIEVRAAIEPPRPPVTLAILA